MGDRSPARTALAQTDWQVTARLLRGTFLDCPIAVPPDLVVVEPAPLKSIEALGPALAQHPVVARVPWLLVLDAERLHLAPRLTCRDFVVRGFSAEELLVRADRALGSALARDTVLHSGMLALDLQAHQAKLGDARLALTPLEFAVLRYLVQNQGRAVSREQLLHAVWGKQYQGGPRTVDVHIRRIRVQLGAAADRLQTLREVGYQWIS